jgi:hypothetical protein
MWDASEVVREVGIDDFRVATEQLLVQLEPPVGRCARALSVQPVFSRGLVYAPVRDWLSDETLALAIGSLGIFILDCRDCDHLAVITFAARLDYPGFDCYFSYRSSKMATRGSNPGEVRHG